jgi:hypothetical protein
MLFNLFEIIIVGFPKQMHICIQFRLVMCKAASLLQPLSITKYVNKNDAAPEKVKNLQRAVGGFLLFKVRHLRPSNFKSASNLTRKVMNNVV